MNELQTRTIKAIVNVFETGKVAGNYGAIAVLPGDSGHLSYGRSQTTLGSGSLFALLSEYCTAPGASLAATVGPWLSRVEGRDTSLDHDAAFHMLLKQAGADPVMRTVQDAFFDRAYFIPACKSAENIGLATALGHAVAYDSYIQGSWARLSAKQPSVKASGGEAAWLSQYLELRRAWLLAAHPLLAATVYRVDALAALLAAGNHDLNLPLTVHGIALTADNL